MKPSRLRFCVARTARVNQPKFRCCLRIGRENPRGFGGGYPDHQIECVVFQPMAGERNGELGFAHPSAAREHLR